MAKFIVWDEGDEVARRELRTIVIEITKVGMSDIAKSLIIAATNAVNEVDVKFATYWDQEK